MGKASRDKGRTGEREVAVLWEGEGAEVRGLEASGDHLVITPGTCGPTIHSEVKRQETVRPWAWWEQASSEAPPGTMPVVHFRRNRSPWLVIVDAATLAGLLCELASRRQTDLDRGPA